VAVRSGLVPGQRLVVRGAEALEDGVPVLVDVAAAGAPAAARSDAVAKPDKAP
jgi:hypothetical protein